MRGSTSSSARCSGAATRSSARRCATARSSRRARLDRGPARRLDRRAGRRHLPARAPRRRCPVRLQRRPELVEELPVPVRAAALDGAPRRRRRPRGDRGRQPAPALRVHRRPLLRPARDRGPGPRVHGGRLRRPGLPRPPRGRVHRRRQLRPGRRRPASASSMDTGPKATSGFDLALTELLEDGGTLPRRGRQRARAPRCWPSCRTARPSRPSSTPPSARSRTPPPWPDARDRHRRHQGAALPQPRAPALGRRRRPLPDLRQLHDGLPDLLLPHASRTSPTSPARRPSAARCGTRASRSTTPTSTAAASAPRPRSRYRQWMTHKLATWIDQFGTSGCVGCGRCITWCPVAIDITEEAAAIRRRRRRRCRTIDELLAEHRRLRAASADEHLDLIAGCAHEPRVRRRRRSCCREGEQAEHVLRDPPRHRGARDLRAPARRGDDRDARTAATCSAGRGSSRPTARCSTPARSASVRAIAFDGACLRGEVRRGPAARLRADEAFRRRSSSSACRRRGSGCSTSMARSPVAEPRPRRARWSRRPTGSPTGARRPHDTWTLELEPGRRGARAASRPGSSRCSTRSAWARCRSRSAATRRRPAGPHDPRGRAGRRAALCELAAAATWSACAARSAPPGRSRRPRARDVVRRRRRDRARAAAARRSTTCSRTASATARSSCSTAGARPTSCSIAAELERWRGRFDVAGATSTVDQRAPRTGTGASASSPTLIAARRLRPRRTPSR